MHEKHAEIPILADLGEPGTPYVGEVGRPKRKRLDVIHGANINRPADRNPKYSLPERKTAATRNALCARLCGNKGENNEKKKHDAAEETQDPIGVMRYCQLRAQFSFGPTDTDNENARTGFDSEVQTTDL